MMSKLEWRVCTEYDDLWSKMVRSKYTRGSFSPVVLVKKHGASNALRGIVEEAPILRKGLRIVTPRIPSV